MPSIEALDTMTTTTLITNNQSRHTVEEEDDEFFGCQSDDNDDNDHKNSTPPAMAAATTAASTFVSVSTDALGQQETKSQEAHFWKIGYHEAHEDYSHEKLQEGFEFGYRNSIGGSIRLGELLGRYAYRHHRHPVNKSHGVKEVNGKGMKKLNGDGSANGSGGAPVRILKGYLEKEQVKDAMDMDTESIKHGMDQVERNLHLAST